MSRGFTLIEVVVALLVLEIAVVGVLGSLVLASEVSRRARDIERSVVAFQSALDSLRGVDPSAITPDSVVFDESVARWSVSDDGWLILSAAGREGPDVRSVVRLPLH